jgi:hypothetical protein
VDAASGDLFERMGMDRHPTTSGSSHLLEGVFLGVSEQARNQKSLKFTVFYA